MKFGIQDFLLREKNWYKFHSDQLFSRRCPTLAFLTCFMFEITSVNNCCSLLNIVVLYQQTLYLKFGF